jgi:hypothetical protein
MPGNDQIYQICSHHIRRARTQPAHGLWLSRNLPQARLVLRDGEGHLGIYDHLGEMLDALTEPDTVA